MSIITKDIDSIIIDKCDLINDFLSIMRVNHNLYNLVMVHSLFIEWKNFYLLNKRDFLNACTFGYFIVCKYLFRTKIINIHDNNEYAFRYSCENGHTPPIFNWRGLGPDKNVEHFYWAVIII